MCVWGGGGGEGRKVWGEGGGQEDVSGLDFFFIRDMILSCHLRNRSTLAVICCVIIHHLEVSCKEDQITSAQRV